VRRAQELREQLRRAWRGRPGRDPPRQDRRRREPLELPIEPEFRGHDHLLDLGLGDHGPAQREGRRVPQKPRRVLQDRVGRHLVGDAHAVDPREASHDVLRLHHERLAQVRPVDQIEVRVLAADLIGSQIAE
jgi:hypothetical protein